MYAAVGAAVTGTVTISSTIAAAAAVHPAPPTRSGTETLLLGSADRTAQRQAHSLGVSATHRQILARAQALAAKQEAMRKALAAAAEARKRHQLALASRYEARASTLAGKILAIAASQAGKPYEYGADGPGSFDCSGFTMYVFGKVGISLPHSSSAQYGVVRHISSSEKRPGDLVFVFNGGGGSIGHVAIYAGNGYWWESPRPGETVGKHRAWSSDVAYGRAG